MFSQTNAVTLHIVFQINIIYFIFFKEYNLIYTQHSITSIVLTKIVLSIQGQNRA